MAIGVWYCSDGADFASLVFCDEVNLCCYGSKRVGWINHVVYFPVSLSNRTFDVLGWGF